MGFPMPGRSSINHSLTRRCMTRGAYLENDGSPNWKEWEDGTDPSDPDMDDDGSAMSRI